MMIQDLLVGKRHLPQWAGVVASADEKILPRVARVGVKAQPHAAEVGGTTQPRVVEADETRRAEMASMTARATTSAAQRGGAMMAASPLEEGHRCDEAAVQMKGGKKGAQTNVPIREEAAARLRDRGYHLRPPWTDATGGPCCRCCWVVLVAGGGEPQYQPCQGVRPHRIPGSPGFRC